MNEIEEKLSYLIELSNEFKRKSIDVMDFESAAMFRDYERSFESRKEKFQQHSKDIIYNEEFENLKSLEHKLMESKKKVDNKKL